MMRKRAWLWGINEVPLMICVEREGSNVLETPGATLVEIEEERWLTPQIVGEAERRFREMERKKKNIGHQ